MAKNVIFEERKDEREPAAPKSKTSRDELLARYKKQNPWKYALKFGKEK